MFSTFLERLSGFFDKHWLLRYFFPSLAFWAAGLAVYAAAGGIAEPLEWWGAQPAEAQLILLAGALVWVTLFAYLLANFGTALIRLFEGYWERPPLKWLREWRQSYYERRFLYLAAEIEQQGADPRQLQSLEREHLLLFPRGQDEEKGVMPTRLGNILRAAELYPLERYGADAVLLWPRLQAFLPGDLAEALTGAQTAMEVMLVLSALSFTFSAIACPLVAATTLSWGLFAACSAGFLLAWVCYRNSLHGALGYAELIKTAFDLHRGKLLEALGLEPPADPDEERRIWDDVSQWIFRNVPYATARMKGAAAVKPSSPKRSWVAEVAELIALVIKRRLPPAPPQAPAPAPPGEEARPQQPPPPPPLPRPRDWFPFVYFVPLLTFSLAMSVHLRHEAQRPVSVVALARSVPSYRLLRAGDLRRHQAAQSEVPSDAIRELPDLTSVSYAAVLPLQKGSILRQPQLRRVDAWQLADMVAIGIPASAATVLGGELRAGDSVDVVIARAAAPVPPPAQAGSVASGESACRAPSLLNLLVLDVKPPPSNGSVSVVVLAAPRACQEALTSSPGRVSLVRRL